MSLFHHHPSPILTRSDYTVFLDAEMDPHHPGRIGRLLFTGHDGSHGVVRALVPGGDLLWEARFVSDHDVNEGLLAFTHGTVISHDRAGKALVGREQWTGKERWRAPLGKLVDRLGVDTGAKEIVAVTFDHAVHGISIETGQDRNRGAVTTDEERATVINGTQFPCTNGWSDGGSNRTAPKGWSLSYTASSRVKVLRRDWAGTHAWGLSDTQGSQLRELGRGRYDGVQHAGPITALSFELSGKLESEDDGEGPTTRHFYLLGEGLEVLGILREGGTSELFDNGQPYWKGAV
jgi:hypothetical protein